MGLTVALSNALSGMKTTQTGLEVVSRNVANSGTAGYHKQALSISEQNSGASSGHAISSGVTRAFDTSLQKAYNAQVSDTSYADVMATFMKRVDSFLGTPGSTNALDTQYTSFLNTIQQLTVSPDNHATRAETVAAAQALSGTLNTLSDSVQSLRQETESQISQQVTALNGDLGSLAKVNNKLQNLSIDDTSRASLLDQRDRLVASVSETIDVRAIYRPNGSVSLMTRSGMTLVDQAATKFSFQPAGSISGISAYSTDPAKSTVGALTVTTPSTLTLDIVGQGILQSGSLGALVDLRDTTLVDAQNQLDEVAAGMASALSTNTIAGVPATVGAATGFDVDLSNIQPGNSFSFTYADAGVDKTVKVIRVDDPAKLPMDYTDLNGTRVLGVDFSAGVGAAATTLNGIFTPKLAISNPSGNILQVLDDGATATTDVKALSASITSPATQDAGLGLNLFVDLGNAAFTNSLDGLTQKLGFAQRVSVNSDILQNNKLLVQAQTGASLGDPARAKAMQDGLATTRFQGSTTARFGGANFRLDGNVGQMVSQLLNFQSGRITAAKGDHDSQKLALNIIKGQQDSKYSVNVDEEMSRLLELQNAYSASARVISTVQKLLDALMQI